MTTAAQCGTARATGAITLPTVLISMLGQRKDRPLSQSHSGTIFGIMAQSSVAKTLMLPSVHMALSMVALMVRENLASSVPLTQSIRSTDFGSVQASMFHKLI